MWQFLYYFPNQQNLPLCNFKGNMLGFSLFPNPIFFIGTSCSNLTDPANGYVTPQIDLVFEDTVVWTCASGYEYCPDCVTTYTAICNASGEWNMTAPACQSEFLPYNFPFDYYHLFYKHI